MKREDSRSKRRTEPDGPEETHSARGLSKHHLCPLRQDPARRGQLVCSVRRVSAVRVRERGRSDQQRAGLRTNDPPLVQEPGFAAVESVVQTGSSTALLDAAIRHPRVRGSGAQVTAQADQNGFVELLPCVGPRGVLVEADVPAVFQARVDAAGGLVALRLPARRVEHVVAYLDVVGGFHAVLRVDRSRTMP